MSNHIKTDMMCARTHDKMDVTDEEMDTTC